MHHNAITEGDTIKSSGYKETPTGEWDIVYIACADSYTKAVQGNNNEGILGDGLKLHDAYGAWVYGHNNAQANTNNLVLKKGVVFNDDYNYNSVYGGHVHYAQEGEASHNTVTFEKYLDGNFSQVYGGDIYLAGEDEGNASASDNTVTINEGFNGTISNIIVATISENGSGKERSFTASDNKLYIAKPAKAEFSNLKIARVYNSSGSTEKEKADVYANNNYGELVLNNNNSVRYITVADAHTKIGKAEANGNILYLTGGKISYLTLAVAGSEGGNFEATANNNTLVLTDAEVDTSIDVAAAGSCGNTEVNGNTLILKGGKYGNVITLAHGGGGSDTVKINDNRVELRNGSSGAPDLSNASLQGSLLYSQKGTETGNSLNFYDVKGMTARSISDFQILNYEYSEMHADDVILTVQNVFFDDNTDVRVKVVNLYGKDNSEFKRGDKVVLLKSENPFGSFDLKQDVKITGTTGISLAYDDVVVQVDDKELILTRPKPDDNSDSRDNGDTRVQPGTKAIAEGAAAGLALVNESSNAAIELLREFSLTASSITPFVHVQASSMRHETGSSINVSAVSLLAGLGTGIDTGAGNLSLGAFFEYGKGSYTTHNSFSNYSDVDGDGNSWYMGGGILAKMDFVHTGPGHFYVEGSAHMGTVHNEYDSNDLFDASGIVAKFDMDSPYYSLHGGLGYVWNMAEGHDLDVYGKYIWTRVQGTDDTLTTKDKFDYDNMDSNRVRFGVRYSYKGSERFSPYVGAAFEHEFSGSCDSRAYGHSVAAPSFEGSSGMGELGLVMKPSADLPLSVNLGVQGYVGQKQGISGSCNFMYEF